MPPRNARSLTKLEHAMDAADSYEEWLSYAQEHDVLSGADLWRHNDESKLYDSRSINHRLQRLRRLRKKGDDKGLLFALNEGIHGNMAGMGKPKLYQKAKAGTKLLIEDYVSEICDALEYLSPRRFKNISWAERIEFFQRASHCYGRSALMLSGGGSLGYFHFGLLKTLIEQKLCPVVISGSSMGAFVAAIVGSRSDEEFLALFEDDYLVKALTQNNEEVKLGFRKFNSEDMKGIKKGMQRLIPDMTFLEAYEKTGRSINISISPAEPNQTSRLLNHIASPNVTLLSAVMASSALPGIFPSVQLQARDADGDIKPYLPHRRWIDGSFSQDLPAKRLARMYGVNHYIVSQVMPGLGREPNTRPGIRKIVTDASVASIKQVVRGYLDFLQRRAGVGPRAGAAMNAVNALLEQRFIGDINIIPPRDHKSLGKLLKMLNEEELAEMIKAGERAAWPKLPVIATTTRIGRTLDRILHAFEVDEAHWLSTAPQTDVALQPEPEDNPRRRKPAPKKRSPRAKKIIDEKAKPPGKVRLASVKGTATG